jgi:hypothetical protein
MSNVVKLHAGDSINLRTGGVVRNDTSTPDRPQRFTVLDSMLRRNNLPALALYFRSVSGNLS